MELSVSTLIHFQSTGVMIQINADDQIWDSIRRSGFGPAMSSHPEGLNTMVAEGGGNWSAGQRQLICLARAMLKNSKIVLLDEATASVDLETDSFIQKAIRKDFASSTILTIAHRLNTIADYDRILVLGNGKMLEFDTPHALLSRDSEFSKMVAETGASNAKIIFELVTSPNMH